MQTETLEAPATQTVADVTSSAALVDALPRYVKESFGRALGQISEVGGIQTATDVVEQRLQELPESVRQVIGRLLQQIGTCYGIAPSKKPLRDMLERLRDEYMLQLASAGEAVSQENREREREVRNVCALFDAASRGIDPEAKQLCLEIYNMSAKTLMSNSEEFERFIHHLRERQNTQLVADVGYNMVPLSIEFGNPNASQAERSNAALVIDKLMDIGDELRVMFFLDAAAAGKAQFESTRSGPVRAQIIDEADQTLTELAWKPGKQLGGLMMAAATQQKKSQYLVLSGVFPILFNRKRDTDFPQNVPAAESLTLPQNVVASASAIAVGLIAAQAAGTEGVIGIPSGFAPGTGAINASIGTPPSNIHHEMSRLGAVNIPYLMGSIASPTFDSSATLQRADPAFKKQGRGTIEAVIMEQLIRRLMRRYMLQLPANANTQKGRHEYLVSKMRNQLTTLQKSRYLSWFDVNDATTPEMENQNQLKIDIKYKELAKVDRMTIQVERSLPWQGAPQTPGQDG